MISMAELRAMLPRRAWPRGGDLMPDTAIYGLLAEFVTAAANPRCDAQRGPGRLSRHGRLRALLRSKGWPPSLGLQRTRVPSVVLFAGLIGAGVGFFMQFWSHGRRLSVQCRRPAAQ